MHFSVNHSKVLAIHALWGLIAVFSEESVMDVLPFRVEVVEDYVGVAGVACGEDDYLEVFA